MPWRGIGIDQVPLSYSDACLLCTGIDLVLWCSGMAKVEARDASARLGQQPGHPKAITNTAKAAKVMSHMTSEASVMSVESDDDVNDLTGKQIMLLTILLDIWLAP